MCKDWHLHTYCQISILYFIGLVYVAITIDDTLYRRLRMQRLGFLFFVFAIALWPLTAIVEGGFKVYDHLKD